MPLTDAVDTGRCYNTSLGYQRYLGHVNTTYSGRQCQRWDVDTPHSRNSYAQDQSMFPEGDLAAAENFCRNPDSDSTFWCYTADPGVRYNFAAFGRASKTTVPTII